MLLDLVVRDSMLRTTSLAVMGCCCCCWALTAVVKAVARVATREEKRIFLERGIGLTELCDRRIDEVDDDEVKMRVEGLDSGF